MIAAFLPFGKLSRNLCVKKIPFFFYFWFCLFVEFCRLLDKQRNFGTWNDKAKAKICFDAKTKASSIPGNEIPGISLTNIMNGTNVGKNDQKESQTMKMVAVNAKDLCVSWLRRCKR